MPLFLFALSQANQIEMPQALLAFLIIHLLVYPASNGYNSYVDRDEGSIGGLEKPPLPTESLFYITLCMDLLAIGLSVMWVSYGFGICLLLYILASRAYSSRAIRLKKYAVIGFLVVVFFQGAFTFYMSSWGITGQPMELNRAHLFLLLGCSFQIAGAYPLTQIYQHEQDLKDGVVTLSYRLGYKGTFLFTALMFVLCNLCYLMYFRDTHQLSLFLIIQVCFLPIILYFGYWFWKVNQNVQHANFRNTMRMNLVAALCMNTCFVILILIRHLPLSYITTIETAVPKYCFSQESLARFYMQSTGDPVLQRKIRVVAAKSGIKKRYSVLNDFEKDPAEYTFFARNADLLPEPGLSQRMAVFKQEALTLSLQVIRKMNGFESVKNQITHLITVTCTGLFAPGLDVELMRELDLNPRVNRSSINFMGCNAAIIALKNADAICRSQPGAKVLLVCTELCTLHFQKQYNDDYILSNLLFADGAAAVLVESEPSPEKMDRSLKINQFNSLVLHNGYHDMAWQLSETGFIMNLTSYVPDLIRENMTAMLQSIGLQKEDVGQWAIHPGGKRILDDFATSLGLDSNQLEASYGVLRDFGNMSSPTVLFVLKALVEAGPKPGNQQVFAAAFGPGLSIETVQLAYV